MNKRRILLGALLVVTLVGAGTRFLSPFFWHYGPTRKPAVIDVTKMPPPDETLGQMLSSKQN